jgi:hypothetical protein
VRLASGAACPASEAGDGAGLDRPAWRLFDAAGRPVSDRMPLCGSAATSEVPAGAYLLAVANGIGKPRLEVYATIAVP